MIFYYKQQPYIIFKESKFKQNGVWIEVIIYQSLNDAEYWVRTKEEFFKLFKQGTIYDSKN